MPADIPIPPQPHELPLPAPWVHDGVRTLGAVPYSVPFGMRAIEMDIHLPASADGPVPLVIYVHGGAFLFGDRRDCGPAYWADADNQFTLLPKAGIAVASLDYRLAGESTFPAQQDDLVAALQYLVGRADELGIDPTRIAVWGESAGAHLAMLLAFDGAPGCPPVVAVVDWFGPSDIRLPFGEMPLPPPSPEERLIGGAMADLPELAAQASPITHVHPGIPPVLVVHGTGDSVVPIAHSHALVDALNAIGADVQVEWIDGGEHAWIGTPQAARIAQDVTLAYLRERLLG